MHGILFKATNGWATTVFYGITNKELKNQWFDYLYRNLPLLAKGLALERVFYSFTRLNGLQASPTLNVQGFIGVNGKFESF